MLIERSEHSELGEVVRLATRVLTDLGEHRTTVAEAGAELAAVAAKGGLRARLIEDVESFDGSVHHDLILHGPHRPTVSLSVATGPGLPWAVRGVARPREYDLLEVNGERVAVHEAIASLDGMFDDSRLLRGLVDATLVGQAFQDLGLELSIEEMQAATDAFRRAHRLYSVAATAAWMQDKGLTSDLLAKLVGQFAGVAKLRSHVVGADVDRWFAAHGSDLDVVVVGWTAGGSEVDAALLADPLAAITASWRAGTAAGLQRWQVGELPAGFTALDAATVGAATAVEHEGVPARAVVVERHPAVQNAETRAAVERKLFDGWLAEQRRTARVTWFWGDSRRTDLVDGTDDADR